MTLVLAFLSFFSCTSKAQVLDSKWYPDNKCPSLDSNFIGVVNRDKAKMAWKMSDVDIDASTKIVRKDVLYRKQLICNCRFEALVFLLSDGGIVSTDPDEVNFRAFGNRIVGYTFLEMRNKIFLNQSIVAPRNKKINQTTLDERTWEFSTFSKE